MTYDAVRDRIVAITGNQYPLRHRDVPGRLRTPNAAVERRWVAGTPRRRNLRPPRWGFALGFDPSRGVVVPFGGEKFTQYNELLGSGASTDLDCHVLSTDAGFHWPHAAEASGVVGLP